jgi:hypothetical protein
MRAAKRHGVDLGRDLAFTRAAAHAWRASASRAGAVFVTARAAVLEEDPNQSLREVRSNSYDIRLMSTGPVIATAGAVAAVPHVSGLHEAPRSSRGPLARRTAG